MRSKAAGACLQLPTGEIYHVQDLGGFQAADQVLVEGTLDPGCVALVVGVCAVAGALAGCVGPNTIAPCAPPPPVFHRGDGDGNGRLELTDAVQILGFLFLGQEPPSCLDAADAQDNGQLELTDAVRILNCRFLECIPPDPPGPPELPCGPDPTAEDPDLGCATYAGC